MKVIKELPISIIQSLKLMSLSSSKLLKAKKETIPVIISLTSIPSRFSTLHLVIKSLLIQDVGPIKIVLWLNEESRQAIPEKIAKLQSSLFEICFTSLKTSHKKLIHTIEKYPNNIVVTCDDDMIYRRNWLHLLFLEHRKHQAAIIGNRTVHINYDIDGNPLPYKMWNYPESGSINPKALMPIGAWGILYPPKSLSETTQDVNLFMKLAPKNDDLWFKAMALINGTQSRQAINLPKDPIPIIGTQKISLKSENVYRDKNYSQWKDLSEYFNLRNIITENFKNVNRSDSGNSQSSQGVGR
jgi:hypothetical protein